MLDAAARPTAPAWRSAEDDSPDGKSRARQSHRHAKPVSRRHRRTPRSSRGADANGRPKQGDSASVLITNNHPKLAFPGPTASEAAGPSRLKSGRTTLNPGPFSRHKWVKTS